MPDNNKFDTINECKRGRSIDRPRDVSGTHPE